jgi:ABC-2 type transport system permease protein
VSGVYYPIAVLPAWLQPVAQALPSAHVFEGMRALLLEGTFRWEQFIWAAALDIVYYVIGVLLLRSSVRHARERGLLMQMGE